MYVCVCNGLRENEVRRAAGEGARTVDEAYRALGAEPNCGTCQNFAAAIIEEVHARRSDPDRVPVAPRAGQPVA